MLAQPYADLPKATVTSGPGNYGLAKGAISISASAGLLTHNIATGIAELELLVDGMVSSSGTLAGGSGSVQPQHGGPLRRRARSPHRGDQQRPGRFRRLHGRADRGEQPRPADQFQRRQPDVDDFARRRSAWPRPPATARISQIELTCLGRVVAQGAAARPARSASARPPWPPATTRSCPWPSSATECRLPAGPSSFTWKAARSTPGATARAAGCGATPRTGPAARCRKTATGSPASAARPAAAR